MSHDRIEGTVERRPSLWLRLTIYRPVSVFMLFLALLVLGLVAFPRIQTQLLPSGMSTGQCAVFIPVRDSTAKEVMETVAKPTEDLIRTLPGLKSVISSSGPQRCMIRLEFAPTYDMSTMVAELRDRLDRARTSWPDSVDDYMIWRQSDSAMPAFIGSLGIELESEVDLDWIFDEIIRRRMERVNGVARVDVWGVLQKRIEVQLDRDLVHAHAIDIRRLIERLSSDNTAVTAGRVIEDDRELLVRFDGRFSSFDEVLDYPVNQEFRIRDIATVDYRTAVRDRLSRVNGKLSRVLAVFKESQANAVDVCARIQEELEALGAALPRKVPGVGEVEMHAWLNQGALITSSVTNLTSSGLIGALCAVVVLFLFFRRLSLTVLVTFAIPFSILITIVWLYFSGGSFNLLSLMGLSLGIGMLVDNSIVVVENILRQGERGFGRREAAIRGVQEVGLAVGLATLTTVMVLLPIFFLGDPRFTQMTQAMGFPLCVSVLASLLVALVFIPQGAIFLQRGRRQGEHHIAAVGEVASKASWLNRLFERGVDWCLGHRTEAILIALVLLASTQIAFRLLPKTELDLDGPRGVEVNLELPSDFSLREANDVFAKVEAAIRARDEEKDLGLQAVTSWFDSGGGELNVFFKPGRQVPGAEFFAELGALPRIPGVKYHYGSESFTRDKGSERLRVYIEANDYDALMESEAKARALLEDRERFPGLGDVARWSEDERNEVRIDVSRGAAQHFGVDTATVSRMVSWALRGAPLPDFVMEEREYPFWIGYDDAQKESVEELDGVLIYRPNGEPVRLENVASYSMTPGSGEIHRRNGKLTAGLSVRLPTTGKDPKGFAANRQLRGDIELALTRLRLPQGARASTRRGSGGFEEDMKNTMMALGMALALVFFIMGLLFESWLLPLSIVFSIPFAFFGSLWLLCITRVAFDAVGMIGMLMLVGIVVNNAIVLVDYINRLRDGTGETGPGLGRRAAILLAVRTRFRPIWMTALTTICGLIPLALLENQGEGVDYRALAVVIIGGLGTSTFFTLFIVPLLYSILDDTRRMARALVSGRSRARPAGEGWASAEALGGTGTSPAAPAPELE